MKLNIIIPVRSERYLAKTVTDLLEKAAGEVEVIVVLDGDHPAEIPMDARIRVITMPDIVGMRECVNVGMAAATGEHVMKIDAHCMVAPGYDTALRGDCDDNWVAIPRRYSLNVDAWALHPNRPVDYHFTSWPFRPGLPTTGLHPMPWKERARDRADYLVDDEMTTQGSCYFTTRRHIQRLGPLSTARYGPIVHEGEEIALGTWLSGGRVVVNKKTWYAHLFKGRGHPANFGFSSAEWRRRIEAGARSRVNGIRGWFYDQPIDAIIDKFWPVPGWPEDWRAQRDQLRDVDPYIPPSFSFMNHYRKDV